MPAKFKTHPSVTSADNASAVSLSVIAEHWNHTLSLTTTGTVTGGTATVSSGGQDVGQFSFTALAPMNLQGFLGDIVITPSGLDAEATFTAHYKSGE